jgi:hypothetical protein
MAAKTEGVAGKSRCLAGNAGISVGTPGQTGLVNRGHHFLSYYFGKPRTATFTSNATTILTAVEYNKET